MGKLILCSGARTKRPYAFASTGIRVYSIEELCYYLYHHVYFIEEDLFSDSLIDWIQTELKLVDRAEKLRCLKEKNADAKTLVTVILCSADYFTEQEIKSLLKELDEIIGVPLIKRNYIKANNCLKNNQYIEAITEYNRILGSKEVSTLTPEDYGDVLHNLAVAKVHITGLKEASELFRQAYERNHKEESLRQYLYSLQLINNDNLYYDKLDEYQVREELSISIKNSLEQKRLAAKASEMMQEIKRLKQWKEQGNLAEYYQRISEMIDSWKSKVRQM